MPEIQLGKHVVYIELFACGHRPAEGQGAYTHPSRHYTHAQTRTTLFRKTE